MAEVVDMPGIISRRADMLGGDDCLMVLDNRRDDRD